MYLLLLYNNFTVKCLKKVTFIFPPNLNLAAIFVTIAVVKVKLIPDFCNKAYKNLYFKGDLAYKFKRIVGKSNFSDQFKKIVKRYIRVRYNLDIMRQSACLVLNPITDNSYGFLFNCTTVGQASDSMTTLT